MVKFIKMKENVNCCAQFDRPHAYSFGKNVLITE